MNKRKTYTAKEIAELKRRRFRGPDAWECTATAKDIEVGRLYRFFQFAEDEFAVGEVMRTDCIAAIYDHAAKEQAEREARVVHAKAERKRAAVEAQKAAIARKAAVLSFHKHSETFWRGVLEPVTEHCSLTLDQLVEHFGDVEDEFAESLQRRKGNAARMLFDAVLSLHFFLLQSRERRVELEHRVEALELEPRLHEGGIWSAGKDYREGAVVTASGSAWVAKMDRPPGKPGESEGWRLLVKRGRDGREVRTP